MASPRGSGLIPRPTRAGAALALRIALTLLVFGLGVWGFALAYSEPRSLADLGFKSLQLVLGRFPQELEDKPAPWPLQVARWGLPVLTAWTTLGVVWLQARNGVRLRLVRLRGDHLVVAGDAGLAARVVTAERRARRAAVVWTGEPAAAWVTAAADLGAPHASQSGEDRGAAGLGLDTARRVLLAGPDDALNVALAGAALDRASQARTSGEALTVIARIDDPDLRAPLEARRARASAGGRAQARFVSLPDVAARRLFLTRPSDRFARGEDAAGPTWILGFGAMAESWLLRRLAAAHHIGGRAAELVVFDPLAERRRDVFLARRPGAAALASVAWRTAPVDAPALLRRVLAAELDAGHQPDAVIVDSCAEALAVALLADGVFAERGLVAPPIYVHGDAPIPADAGVAVVGVGGMDELADPELLLQDTLDGAARAIHEVYLEGRLDAGEAIGTRISLREWDDLPEEVRDDNRLVADCYALKLRDIGARIAPGASGGFAFEPHEIEALARAEHDRWAAAKLLTGWTHGEVRDDVRKLHPDLIAYDALTEAVRDLDRDQIRLITRVSATGGRRPARDLVLALDPTTPSLDAVAVKALIATTAARHPERAVVFLGVFENEAHRRTLQAAAAAGAPVRLVLAAPPDALIDAALAPERSPARRLLQQADRIHDLSAPEWTSQARLAFVQSRTHVRVGGAAARSGEPPVLRVRSGGAPAWDG